MAARSISFHLGLLVVMVAAPLLLLTIGLLLWSAALSRQAADRGLDDTARMLAIAVEQEIATWSSALKALTASPDLGCEPSQRFYEQAKTVAAQQGGWVSLVDATGAQRMNTLRPLGTALPSLPEAARMREAMKKEGQPFVSDVFIGPLLGGPLVFISVPFGTAGKPPCWLSMAFAPDQLTSLLQPPANSSWSSILTDSRGSLITATGSWLDHGPVRMVDQGVNAGRWTLAVAAPRAALNAAWVSPVAVGAIGSLLMIAAALAVAGGYARHMKREVDNLVARAARVGEPPATAEPLAVSVAELGVLQKALARAEEDVRQSRIEHEMRMASEAQRIAAESASHSKDLFLATLSHELRGPLTAVIGWLDMARVSLDDEATLRNALNIALRNAKQQGQIIEDLLDVSRIVSGKFSLDRQAMDLGRLAREVVEAWRPAAEEKALELGCTVEEPALIHGDRQRMQQVLGNLIGNAIKFNRTGGWVQLALERRGAHLRLAVADSGCGIEPGALAHVFERFWQGDAGSSRKHFGLGLGLSLVQHIVERHEGSVWAESRGRGCGARFTVELPAIGVLDVPREDAPRREVREPGLSGLAVVAVDDNDDTLGWLELVLTRQGARVWIANAAEDALALLDRVRPDLLVSDLAMPGRDGYALIQSVRERPCRRRIAALAFSGQATPEARARALGAGFDAFVAKPCDAETLVAALTELAARQADLEPECK